MKKLISNPDESYMAVALEGNSNKEVIAQMASALQEEGYVKDSFCEAITKREETYPTGLPMGGINVAIPHTDPEHVNKAGICMGILKEPVTFCTMGTEGETIEVSILFMLSIKHKEEQMDMLQKLISVCQDQSVLEQILDQDIDVINEVLTKLQEK